MTELIAFIVAKNLLLVFLAVIVRQKNICWTAKQKKAQQVTAVWQKWRFSAPQTHLWLIKVWFSASTFVVKIATFAKPQNVSSQCKKTTTQQTICYLKTKKGKRNNEQPTHKTTHLQAPTHKPILQLAKEFFSCRHTAVN